MTRQDEQSGKIAVGLYEFVVKQAVDGERKFCRRIGTAVVDTIDPLLTVTVEGEDRETTFSYDELMSKQIGHNAYLREQGAKATVNMPLTPLQPAAIAAPAKEKKEKKPRAKKS